MTGDVIPPPDHLALHCQPSAFLEHDEAGNPIGINTDAFRVDANGISTNWLEFDGVGDYEACFKKACELLKSARKVKKSHRVALMQVAQVEAAGQAAGISVKAIHDPLVGPPANPGHSLVVGAQPSDTPFLQALTLIVELRPFA